MAGLYLHIPFCKQACHYCNFHFSTSTVYAAQLVDALMEEIDLRAVELEDQVLDSVYFGGGTPSLLSPASLERLYAKIQSTFKIKSDAEYTLEANPDDLNPEMVHFLAHSPVNRLSIGIQSFSDADLQFMNRAHSAEESIRCLDLVFEAGFKDISIDLIYGSPSTTMADWVKNLRRTCSFPIPHISCYALTLEPKTALYHWVQLGKVRAPDDQMAADQFERARQFLENAGFEHYEISNFSKPGRYAKHNTAYWFGAPYLGIGPAAHSFDGQRTRQWNIAHNKKYMEAIRRGLIPAEKEVLTDHQRFNELIMTGLRTQWGIRWDTLKEYGSSYFERAQLMVPDFQQKGLMVSDEVGFRLSDRAKFQADGISMAFFMDA